LVISDDPPAAMPERTMSDVILLAEDNDSVRALFALVLRGEGYALLEARSGADALGLARAAARVDLLLTDRFLAGGISGPELARALRAQRPALPVVYATGVTHGLHEEDPDGVVLSKPFAIEDLVATLGAILSSPGPTADARVPLVPGQPRRTSCPSGGVFERRPADAAG
jgi:CheY-like chemotaxis protein